MRKTGALLGTLALILMMGAGCSAGSVTTTDSNTTLAHYENKTNKFELDYPKDWEKKEDVPDTVAAFVSPQKVQDDFAENITVTIKKTDADVHDYVASAVRNAPKSYDDFVLIDDKPTTLGGAEAEMITYTFTYNSIKPYTREVFAVKNGTLYDVTFTASQDSPEDNWDVAQKILASFKITE